MKERQEGRDPSCLRATIRSSQRARRSPTFARSAIVGGKSELRRAVRRVTPGQGDLKESGTENTQPNPPEPARVKASGNGEKVR